MTSHPATAVRRAAAAIVIRDDVPPEQWDAFVQRRADAAQCHLSAWRTVMTRAFAHRSRYLAAVADDEIVGILPLVLFNAPLFGKFIVSMPFLNGGGVVAETQEAAEALLEAAVAEARAAGARYLELRHVERTFPALASRAHKVGMTLRLQPTVDDQWRVLDRKLRNQVRKAEKEGLRTEIGGGELLDEFYGVMAQNMRDLGSPVHAPRFFAEVLDAFPGTSRLFVVRLGARPVAASLVLWHRGTVEVPWASSLRAYNRLCANVQLYWDMLRFAIAQGHDCFDFGRSTPLEGTYQFKKQWGAEPEDLRWEYWLAGGGALPDRSPKNPKFSAAIALWQRLPVAVTRLAGPLIVRNIP